jgi:hypothetical protein
MEYGYRIFKNKTCEGLTKNAILRYKNAKNKKDKSLIKKEIKICKKFWGCYPTHYFRYNLFLKNICLTENELINYIPEYFFYNLFLPFFDRYEHRYVLEDKIITEQMFQSLNIPTPSKIGSITKNCFYNNNFEKISIGNIINVVNKFDTNRIVMKPNFGGGGKGIIFFNKEKNNKFITKNGVSFEDFFSKRLKFKHEYIFQAGIVQNKFLNEIYPQSINTLRVITQNFNGNVKILYSILRMGRDGNELDNLSKNGIFVEVDKNSGAFSKYAASKNCEYFYKHPNTGFVFAEKKIEHWDEIKKLVVRWTEKLPKYTYLGWDIALSLNGPVVIEVNLGFGLDSIQILSGGMRNVFEIKNPKEYWKNKIKN